MLKNAGVATFTFKDGQATAQDTADAVIPLLGKMANKAISEPKPFLYTFGTAGHLNKVDL